MDTRGSLNESIERRARRHRTKTDQWIDTVAERVEDRLDRDVQVAARRISQSQSFMESMAWLLVLYMEQKQQADALREWASSKRSAMEAPVERPADGPLASLSDDALRFLSTHEGGAVAGYQQFAEERYSAYADRKRAKGEVPQSMDAYYGIQWGDAVRSVRDERSYLGSLPRPAREFLHEAGESKQFAAWRAEHFRKVSTATAPDIAPAAIKAVPPEFAAYLAENGQRWYAYSDFAAAQFKRVQTRREAIGEHLYYRESVDEHRARTGTGNPPSGGFTKTRELGED